MSRRGTRRPSLSLSASSGKRTLPSDELSTSNDSLWYVMCKSYYRRKDEQLLVFSENNWVLLCCKFLLGLEKLHMVLTTLSTKIIALCVWLCLQACNAVCVFMSACVYVSIVNLSSLFSKEVAPPPYGVVALPPQYLGHLAEPQPWNCYCLRHCISFVCVWLSVCVCVFHGVL